jgi:hypothetical protein
MGHDARRRPTPASCRSIRSGQLPLSETPQPDAYRSHACEIDRGCCASGRGTNWRTAPGSFSARSCWPRCGTNGPGRRRPQPPDHEDGHPDAHSRDSKEPSPWAPSALGPNGAGALGPNGAGAGVWWMPTARTSTSIPPRTDPNATSKAPIAAMSPTSFRVRPPRLSRRECRPCRTEAPAPAGSHPPVRACGRRGARSSGRRGEASRRPPSALLRLDGALHELPFPGITTQPAPDPVIVQTHAERLRQVQQLTAAPTQAADLQQHPVIIIHERERLAITSSDPNITAAALSSADRLV